MTRYSFVPAWPDYPAASVAHFLSAALSPVSRSTWVRLEDAVVAANFWMLDAHGGRYGLDNSMGCFASRHRGNYYLIRRWSPDDALWDLGRLFFDLAGLDEVRLY
jgi:hypothetical protein